MANNKRRRLILASSSPRRRELLEKLGCSFQVMPSQVGESINEALAPDEYVKELSRLKALNVASRVSNGIIIAADTVVVLDGVILGKPETSEKAQQMLRALSGKEHQVVTGVVVVDAKTKMMEQEVVTTNVKFRKLSDNLINRYVDTGEPLDKAGAYAIQGKGALLVESIEGCYYNVVGLPLVTVSKLLEGFGAGLI